MTPAGIDPASHAASVPFMRAIGAEWLGGDADDTDGMDSADGIRMRLPLATHVCVPPQDAGGTRCIDLGAVVALLDHAGGAAVYAALPSIATATLELRVDISGTVQPGAGVVVGARVAAIGHGSALVLGHACSVGDEAAPVLHSSARYIVGSAPGQAPADAAYLATRDAGVARFANVGLGTASSFDALLGGVTADAGWQLPFAPRLVGSVVLPALHGGVVAAGLMQAVNAAACNTVPHLRLSSITVRYLRAALAVDTLFSAVVAKAGGRAAFIDGRVLQGDRVVATAQALFG